VAEGFRNFIIRSYICTLHQILLRWTGYVARMRYMINVFKILVGKPKEKRPLGRPIIDGRKILKCILGK
jgi:hypothetical protein